MSLTPCNSAPTVASPGVEVPTDHFSLRITGIGGTGVVTVSQILATAGMLDGFTVTGLDPVLCEALERDDTEVVCVVPANPDGDAPSVATVSVHVHTAGSAAYSMLELGWTELGALTEPAGLEADCSSSSDDDDASPGAEVGPATTKA